MNAIRDDVDARIEAALAYREQDEDLYLEVGKPPAEEHKTLSAERLSQRAIDLIIEFETGGRAFYERRYRSRPVWPKAKSGITIGCGYDLGYVDVPTFESDWAKLLAGLSKGQQNALRACVGRHAGKQGPDAMRALLPTVSDIIIRWDLALEVFFARTLPKFAAVTASSLPNNEKLSGDCFGVLVSLTFNRGNSYAKPHDPAKDPRDRYREMRAIRALVAAGNFAGIPAQIRAMVRLWIGTDVEEGLRRRRMAEARLFEEGLASSPAKSSARRAEPLVSDLIIFREPGLGDGDSWDGPSDEDFWADRTEDDLASAAEGGVVAGFLPNVVWAPDNAQPDYSHLGPDLPVGGVFSLKAEDLERLATLNSFNVEALGRTPILFGLRGAGIVKDHTEPGGVVLIDQRPDHGTAKCVIGVWDRSASTVKVFPGSTVPNREAVISYRATREAGNLLPTGLYHYVCGAHTTKRQSTPGAFLLRKPDLTKRVVIVRRSIDDLVYERSDMIHPCAPGDNIHPAFCMNTSYFSSLGCQTVTGTFKNGVHQGPWAEFRKAAGFTDNDGEPGKRFMYMLLTGTECRLAAELRLDGLEADPVAFQALRRLRFGSEGPAVTRLQQSLGLSGPDGKLGRNTAEAVYARQAQQPGLVGADGIWSPAMDERFGWDVLAQ